MLLSQFQFFVTIVKIDDLCEAHHPYTHTHRMIAHRLNDMVKRKVKKKKIKKGTRLLENILFDSWNKDMLSYAH